MKKVMKYWAIILCPVLFAVSCEKENGIVNNENDVILKYETRTVTVVFPEDPATKVSLAEDGKTAWEAGDQILIHGQKMGNSGEEYYSRIVTLSAGDIHDSGKTATFELESIIADKSWGRTGYKATLFAAYPASAVTSVSGGTSWYYTTGFSTSNTLLLGGCNDTSVNDGNTFTFMPLCGVLSFIVDGDYDSYVFMGNGGSEVVGYDVFAVRVDMESSWGDKNAIPYNGGSGIKCSGEKTSVTGSVVSDGSTVNRIYFPGGVNLSGFTIKFYKGGDLKKILSTNTAKNIAVGKYLKLGDVTSYLKTYVPPTEHIATHPAITGAEDLGASSTANCYVVDGSVDANKDKVFKFKAVKGNGSAAAGSIDNVVVLWETYNTTESVTANTVIAEADFEKKDGEDDYWITFKMPSTLHAGNAVIAAKDSGNNILWSWHIWVPSTTLSTIEDATFASSDVMDRNLGALVPATATESEVPTTAFGLYYQWGRKDPFLTSDWGRNTSVAFSYSSSTWVETETAVQNPTVLYKKKSDDGTYNWNSSEITTLWDDGGKTIYDPCPPGYKVDVYDSGKRFWKYSDTSGWEANTTYGWVKFGSIVFPLAGYTENLSAYKVKERTVLWSATYKDKERGYGVYTSPLPSYHSYYKYYAASVRCVEE